MPIPVPVRIFQTKAALLSQQTPLQVGQTEGKSGALSVKEDVFVFGHIVLTFPSMNAAPRWIGLCAGLLGFSGVALGAFGAHALKETLVNLGSLDTWHTAVLYHLVHAVALLAIAKVGGIDQPALSWIARFWIIGVIFFSGSLYWLALGGPKVLGPITPLGGLGFLIGWAAVAWDAVKTAKA